MIGFCLSPLDFVCNRLTGWRKVVFLILIEKEYQKSHLNVPLRRRIGPKNILSELAYADGFR